MKVVRSGITRTVVLTKRHAYKLAKGHVSLARGLMANASEWQQRREPYVCGPTWTLAYLVQSYPLAEEGDEDRSGPWSALSGDDGKACSWGWLPGRGWLMIDFDESLRDRDRFWLARIYWWRQERLARKWMALA